MNIKLLLPLLLMASTVSAMNPPSEEPKISLHEQFSRLPVELREIVLSKIVATKTKPHHETIALINEFCPNNIPLKAYAHFSAPDQLVHSEEREKALEKLYEQTNNQIAHVLLASYRNIYEKNRKPRPGEIIWIRPMEESCQPLTDACEQQNTDMIGFLISMGEIPTLKHLICVIRASWWDTESNNATVKLFLDTGTDFYFNARISTLEHPLSIALERSCDKEIISLLIKKTDLELPRFCNKTGNWETIPEAFERLCTQNPDNGSYQQNLQLLKNHMEK